jgi:hypothetical protein
VRRIAEIYLVQLGFWHLRAMMVHELPLAVDFLDEVTKTRANGSLRKVKRVNSAPHAMVFVDGLRALLVPFDRSDAVDLSKEGNKVLFNVSLGLAGVLLAQHVAQRWPESCAFAVMSDHIGAHLGLDGVAPRLEHAKALVIFALLRHDRDSTDARLVALVSLYVSR